MEEDKKFDFEVDIKDCRIEKESNGRILKCKIIDLPKSQSVITESVGSK